VDIIPVIDLLHGQVVRARHGERHLYRPIQSRLCDGSDALEIVHALLELYPFKTLYIADLDAIGGHGSHHATIQSICVRYPQLGIWLDAGLQHPQHLQAWHDLPLDLVIGSERLISARQLEALARKLGPARMLLSLDFGSKGFIGAPEILNDASLWPARLIAMTLTRVGSEQGPDFDILGELVRRAGNRQIIAAGGIRGRHDLETLEQIGVTGALVASALHDGHLTTEHLAQ
jgi:phosphoribosylformimino-5-aminoimidazole carboxamide ribotide isomerase